MIGSGKRDETFRVLRRTENTTCILNTDDLIRRRMEDEQGPVQGGDALLQLLLGDIVEKRPAYAKRAATERHVNVTARALRAATPHQPGDVGGIAGRGDRDHSARFGHVFCRGEHSRSAQAVPDQKSRGLTLAPKLGSGCHQIRNVGRKRRVGEFAVARAQPGEVEAQHRNPERREPFGDALCGMNVLPAGEAMGKQRIGARLIDRRIEQRGEALACRIKEVKPFGWHIPLLGESDYDRS